MKKLFLLILLAVPAAPCLAAEEGWDFSLGAGLLVAPVYEGSGDTCVSPLPRLSISYSTGSLSFSASLLDGLGISYLHGGSGILASLKVAPGPGRDSEGYSTLLTKAAHSDGTQRLLEGTPAARGVVSTDLTLGALTAVGLFGVTVGYRPTQVGQTYHAFTGAVIYMIELNLTDRLSLSALASLEAMDARYAEAWYSLAEDTPALTAFDARAGLRAAQLAVEASAMISGRIGLSLLARELVLLGDAAESPYTEKRLQAAAVLQAFYEF